MLKNKFRCIISTLYLTMNNQKITEKTVMGKNWLAHPNTPWLEKAENPGTGKGLRVVQSASQMSVFTRGWMSSILCCTAATNIRLRNPVLNRGPALVDEKNDSH